jgi:acetyltransferase
LGGVRGRAPVDVGALEKLLVRFSQLVVEQPWIKELDINPLWLPRSAHSPRRPRRPPRPADRRGGPPADGHQAVPDPVRLGRGDPDGERVRVRPIRPEDEPLMVRFHETLSEQSVYMRYFHMMKLDQRTAHERLRASAL